MGKKKDNGEPVNGSSSDEKTRTFWTKHSTVITVIAAVSTFIATVLGIKTAMDTIFEGRNLVVTATYDRVNIPSLWPVQLEEIANTIRDTSSIDAIEETLFQDKASKDKVGRLVAALHRKLSSDIDGLARDLPHQYSSSCTLKCENIGNRTAADCDIIIDGDGYYERDMLGAKTSGLWSQRIPIGDLKPGTKTSFKIWSNRSTFMYEAKEVLISYDEGTVRPQFAHEVRGYKAWLHEHSVVEILIPWAVFVIIVFKTSSWAFDFQARQIQSKEEHSPTSSNSTS